LIEVIILLIGLISGVAINYIADVFPENLKIKHPVCLKCKTNISIFDYLFLKKCLVCNSYRSIRSYLLVVLSPLISIGLFLRAPDRLGYAVSFLVFFYLLLVSIIDLEHRLVLLPLTGIGGLIFFGVGVHLHGWIDTVLGGVAGFIIMYGFYGLGILFSKWISYLRGNSHSEPGMGKGDVSVSLILGFLLGWPGITAGIFLGVIIAGLASAIVLVTSLITKTYRPNIGIPYVPFLALSCLLLLFR
jgi:leader peptidase (prepilin peptidase)/N-methyltransferase